MVDEYKDLQQSNISDNPGYTTIIYKLLESCTKLLCEINATKQACSEWACLSLIGWMYKLLEVFSLSIKKLFACLYISLYLTNILELAVLLMCKLENTQIHALSHKKTAIEYEYVPKLCEIHVGNTEWVFSSRYHVFQADTVVMEKSLYRHVCTQLPACFSVK